MKLGSEYAYLDMGHSALAWGMEIPATEKWNIKMPEAYGARLGNPTL